MKYDFTTIIDRHNKDAIAVDKIPFDGVEIDPGFDKIPMWIADMNFATVPTIQNAMIERIKHPTFGYFKAKDEYFEKIISWQRNRNGVHDLNKEQIGYQNGVLGALSSALHAFTLPGEAVLVHSPTYIGFTHVLEENGRKIVHSPLKRDEHGIWRMNYEDMDIKIKENNIHFVIFCSPHNPTGRVWEKEEIELAMEVYKRNDCIVISDEIWSDLILSGYHHIPTQSISEDAKQRTIALYAPSKTFNLAGLIGSYDIIYNRYLRDKMRKEEALSHYNSMNVLSEHALIGAYAKEGYEWVDELCQVLSENVAYAYEFICDHFNGVELAKPQGTYMLYLDCSKYCNENNITIDELIKAGIKVGVIWQDGRPFLCKDSIRMNLALPKSRVMEAFRRLDQFVFNKK